jgi:hypothetical protein
MNKLLIIIGLTAIIAAPAQAEVPVPPVSYQCTENMSERACEMTKQIELIRLQQYLIDRKAYEERMKEHAKKLDCIVCD